MWHDLAGDQQTRRGAAPARPRAAAPRPRPDRPGVRAAAGRPVRGGRRPRAAARVGKRHARRHRGRRAVHSRRRGFRQWPRSSSSTRRRCARLLRVHPGWHPLGVRVAQEPPRGSLQRFDLVLAGALPPGQTLGAVGVAHVQRQGHEAVLGVQGVGSDVASAHS